MRYIIGEYTISSGAQCDQDHFEGNSPQSLGTVPMPSKPAIDGAKPHGMYTTTRTMGLIGYTDAFRSLHVGEIGHFTFWDYFRQALQNNRGVRIDRLLFSPTLADRLECCEIDKGPRAQEKPSDHTPIIVTLSDLP
jgi:exonuclease III